MKLRLDYKGKDGVSERQRLEQVWLTLDVKPDALVDPEIPIAGEFLYTTFWELFQREHGVSWEAMYQYQLLYGIEFTGEDISVLRALGSTAISWLNKKEKPATQPPPSANKQRTGHAPRKGRG